MAILACLTTLVASVTATAPGAAAAGDPLVLQRHVAGPVAIPAGRSVSPLAKLHVPSGRWVAWAKLLVRYDGPAIRRVACDLVAKDATGQDRHDGQSTVGALGDPDARSISLAVSRSSLGVGGMDLALRCHGGGLSGAEAARIRIMAMRVGRLERVALATGSTTNSGNGSPRAVAGHRSGDVDIPVAVAPQTIAEMDLPAGRWWVRTSYTVRSAGGGSANPSDIARCRLVVGASSDRIATTVVYQGVEFDRGSATMDIATQLAGPDTAALRCSEDTAGVDSPDLKARDIRITAVKLGRLSIEHAVRDGVTTVTGSGLPRVIHGWVRGPIAVADALPWTTAATIHVPAGRWMMMGKLWATEATSGLLVCRLRAGSDTDTGEAYYVSAADGVPLQLIHTFGGAGTARIECRVPAEHDDVMLRWIRITAVRVTSR